MPDESVAPSQVGGAETNGRMGHRGTGRSGPRFLRRQREREILRLGTPDPAQASSLSIPEGLSEPAIRRREALYRRAVAAADGIAVLASIGAAIAFFGLEPSTPLLLFSAPLAILINKAAGLYDYDSPLIRKTTLDEAPRLFFLATLLALLALLGSGSSFRASSEAAQIPALWALMFVALLAARAGARKLVRSRTAPERCLVLGDEASAMQIRRKLASDPAANATVIGRMALTDPSGNGTRVPLRGEVELLGLVLVEDGVDRVIIAPTDEPAEVVLDTIRMTRAMGINVSVLPRLLEVVGSSARFDELQGLVLLGVPRWGLSASSRVLKRAFDLVGATLVLVALAPLFGMIAAAVKLNSPGPVLFRQRRIGAKGREFDMFKFRSMVKNADETKIELVHRNEAEGLFKIANDPRITRVGMVLRRFSFDELPQLINVIRGEMSLVGPRPLVPEEDGQIDGWHRRRGELPPGMTGAWQVMGSSRIPLEDMVKIDYLYGANWSPWVDLKVLVETALFVAARRGL